jgi:hypothetical protein
MVYGWTDEAVRKHLEDLPAKRVWAGVLGPQPSRHICAGCRKFLGKDETYIHVHTTWKLHLIPCFIKKLKQIDEQGDLLGVMA